MSDHRWPFVAFTINFQLNPALHFAFKEHFHRGLMCYMAVSRRFNVSSVERFIVIRLLGKMNDFHLLIISCVL